MKSVVAFFVCWIGLILQVSVFQIPPFNVLHPDFVLVTLVMIALTRGPKSALICGILIGFIQDVDYGSFIGLNAFAYGVIGYFSATTFLQFLHRNVAITFLVTIVSTFVHEWLTYGLTRMFDVTAFTWTSVLSVSLRQMIVNGILLLLLYPFLTKWFSHPMRNRYGDADNEMVK